jgi:hypothetical protein
MSQRSGGLPNILQLVRTTSLKVLGKPGATAGAGLAGGTTSGAPTSGQFEAGDAVVAQNGHLWICTVAGSPGTWVDAGASGSYTDPLTTRGDLVVRGAASTGRLALGASGYVLTSDGTDAAWAAAAAGFADPMTTRGDIIVRGGSGTTRLALGSSGQQLRSDGTDAAWATPALTKLAETILGASASTIDLSSISGSYRHLRLDVVGRGDNAQLYTSIGLRLNGDSSSIYDTEFTQATAASGYSSSSTNAASSFACGYLSGSTAAANTATGTTVTIYDYARTQWNKALRAESMINTTTSGMYIVHASGQWRSTAAVTQLTVILKDGSNILSGTVATLWGFG